MHPHGALAQMRKEPGALRKEPGALRKDGGREDHPEITTLKYNHVKLDQKGLYVTLRAGHVAQGTAGLYVPRPENVWLPPSVQPPAHRTLHSAHCTSHTTHRKLHNAHPQSARRTACNMANRTDSLSMCLNRNTRRTNERTTGTYVK